MTPTPSDAPTPATFGQRARAAAVDGVICVVAGAMAGTMVAGFVGLSGGSRLFAVFLGVFVAGLCYSMVLEGSVRQATVGKRMVGIAVTDLDGEALSRELAALRHLGKTASALPLFAGFITAIRHPRHQAWHDLAVGSLVVVRSASAGDAVGAATETDPQRRGIPLAQVSLERSGSTTEDPGSTPPPARPGPQSSHPTPPPAAPAAAAPRPPARRTTVANEPLAQTLKFETVTGWSLEMRTGANAGQSHPLSMMSRLGRDPQCDVSLSDDRASRTHAEIYQQPEGFYIRDLGSSNGTYVEGVKITEPRLLRPGETISIGATRMVLRAPADWEPPPGDDSSS
jgi:uncharacterized RDD family membrane protein YckC